MSMQSSDQVHPISLSRGGVVLRRLTARWAVHLLALPCIIFGHPKWHLTMRSTACANRNIKVFAVANRI